MNNLQLHQAPKSGRRKLMNIMGASVLALGILSALYTPVTGAQDMSNGANNFYTSEQVTKQQVICSFRRTMTLPKNCLPLS